MFIVTIITSNHNAYIQNIIKLLATVEIYWNVNIIIIYILYLYVLSIIIVGSRYFIAIVIK